MRPILCATLALLALSLAACAAAPPAPAPQAAALAAAPPPSPTPLPRPSATLARPTATPVPPSPTPPGPPRVGIQVGHWKIEEHADEMAKLRAFSGSYYGGYDEWEINMAIAEPLVERLEAAGVTVDLLPSRIPVGYSADIFITLHADGATGAEAATRRGWKLATPFRASPASRELAAAISATYPAITGLPADPLGASYNMRAYYAFAYYRYWHAIAPTTPAVIIECGFMTHPADRALLFEQPDRIAEGIAAGVLDYLARRDPADTAALRPLGAGMQRPTSDGVPLRARASATSGVLLTLASADRLVPMAVADGWVLVFTYGGSWELGWVRPEELRASGEPLLPPTPRP